MLLRHHPTKKSFALRFIKLSLVFNSNLLIGFVLTTFNTSLDQPPVWISWNWFKRLRILDNSPRKNTLAFTIWDCSIQSISDLWLDIHIAFSFELLTSWPTVCKRSLFLQFCDQIQSTMHQIVTQIQIIIDCNTGRVTQNFHKPRLKRCFPAFHWITFWFCCLPSFFFIRTLLPYFWEPKDIQDFNRFWIASPYVFFPLRWNFLPFFPHRNSLPQSHM